MLFISTEATVLQRFLSTLLKWDVDIHWVQVYIQEKGINREIYVRVKLKVYHIHPFARGVTR